MIYEYIKCTNLEELPKHIQDYVLRTVERGIKEKVIFDFKLFMKVDHCIYTSQMLAYASKGEIKVVEGLVIGPNRELFRHSWNFYGGYHFNLIKRSNHHLLLHYGTIIPNEKLLQHLKEFMPKMEFIYPEPEIPSGGRKR